MNRLRDTARQWLAQDRSACVVEIVRVEGSAPRAAGTRLLVSATETQGTIGGGHLEWLASDRARTRLAAGDWPQAAGSVDGQDAPERLALGPSLGQCCGGVVWLRYRKLDAALLAQWPDEAARLRVAVFGAGHVGQALVSLLTTLPCQIDWIDERPEALELNVPATPEQITRICTDSPVAELDTLPDASCVVIMTHSHASDFELCKAALQADRFRWVGVIGSQTKAARFRHQLRDRGLNTRSIEQLICPIGLPGIAGREPAVIAVAVAAQLLSLPPLKAPQDSRPWATPSPD